MEAGHIVTVERNIGCTIVQNGGPSEGEIVITVITADGVAITTKETSLAWEEPAEPEGLSGQVMALSGGGLLLLIAGVTLLLLRRKQEEQDSEEVQMIQPSGPPATLAGPAANVGPAAQAGPPASTTSGPPLPSSGLPEGWSMEQWDHYGHQWLAQQQQADP